LAYSAIRGSGGIAQGRDKRALLLLFTTASEKFEAAEAVVILPSPQPKSGLPDFGHSLTLRKSDISDFRWERAARYFEHNGWV